ncbi:hypothetical protein [Brenneria rubrifaciens]|uniref:hypothetical protein n=1 Tax=Brenneria rubrifaciens TaxID=55213 RepID=UPI001586363E|nr:hypothetical protein [Brenneria rubrifaciens]
MSQRLINMIIYQARALKKPTMAKHNAAIHGYSQYDLVHAGTILSAIVPECHIPE